LFYLSEQTVGYKGSCSFIFIDHTAIKCWCVNWARVLSLSARDDDIGLSSVLCWGL